MTEKAGPPKKYMLFLLPSTCFLGSLSSETMTFQYMKHVQEHIQTASERFAHVRLTARCVLKLLRHAYLLVLARIVSGFGNKATADARNPLHQSGWMKPDLTTGINHVIQLVQSEFCPSTIVCVRVHGKLQENHRFGVLLVWHIPHIQPNITLTS